MVDATIRAFCAQQREWLDLELQSEQEEEASIASDAKRSASSDNDQQRSHVLHGLEASDVSAGLYGRTVVRFTAVEEKLLPAHRFTTGDEVEIRNKSKSTKKGQQYPTGVVSEVTETSISVALFSKQQKGGKKSNDDEDDENGEEDFFSSSPLSLLPKSSVEVHKKLMAALNELETKGVDHPICGKIVQALFDETSVPKTAVKASNSKLQTTNENLDDSQVEAISFALSSNFPIALIHGPPGTGKTTTVVELIQQAVQTNGWKVLVTAPSNVAVDNVLARLVEDKKQKKKGSKKSIDKLQVVRLGHPARLQANILPYSLEALVQRADGTEIVKDVRSELEAYLKVLNGKSRKSEDKRLAYREVKSLRKEVRVREEKVVQELLSNASVVLATCVGAANQRLLRDLEFDMVVIDEAAQSLEAACWIPALQAKRKLVLAGDHCQLPPTIKCNTSAVQRGLGKTMFERVMELYGDNDNKVQGKISRMLKIQYRMHENIADWASQALYGGQLVSHDSVKKRTLGQLRLMVENEHKENSSNDLISNTPLLMIDTAGCAMYESTNAAGSRFNEGEAELVKQHVRKLLDMGIAQEEIAVITPYNGQVELLRMSMLPDSPKLQIRSVDGFQGGEREAVVLSLVRSSERGGMDGIGFLRDERRLNVAITRAKRHCCVICDAETVSQSIFIQNLVSWVEQHGEQRSALEFMSGVDLELEADLVQAEIELQRIKQETKHKKEAKEHVSDAEIVERKEKLFERIQNFKNNNEAGAQLVMSDELSKLDRKLVHEIAEQIGLAHRSEGVEGINRRITVMIPKSKIVPEQAESTNVNKEIEELVPSLQAPEPLQSEKGNVSENESEKDTPESVFSRLQIDEESEDDGEQRNEKKGNEVDSSTEPRLNSLLGDLAKERAERQKQQSKATAVLDATKKKKAPKKKGQKLGGAKRPDKTDPAEGLDDLDDIAFLDAQINRVQTSHGRKLDGSGNNYRTIMNGVLLSKPKPQEKKKDTKASAALQKKLKSAQNDRKAKVKKK